ncbi:MAG: hypothetical protein KDA42_12005 [Planctomycetales bacterium]|nr:hypothetical protein [Planctomycetales bacterium]
MRSGDSKVLGVRDIASVLFATQNPSERELRAVEAQFAAGRLHGQCVGAGAARRWITTPRHLANYMASTAYNRQLQAAGKAVGAGVANSALCSSYRSVLSDYFQALIFRRRHARRDKRFQVIVVAGQATVVVAAFVLAILSLRPILPPTLTAEQATIFDWGAQRYARFEVIKFYQPENSDEADRTVRCIRVRYRYFRETRGKGIETDRVFRLRGDEIVSVDSFG